VIAFNANESTPSNGASITNYHWNWGDNTADEDTSNAVITHTFGSVNSFQVQLTITDSQGRTSIFRLAVPVV
jgi:PKD repeat protein